MSDLCPSSLPELAETSTSPLRRTCDCLDPSDLWHCESPSTSLSPPKSFNPKAHCLQVLRVKPEGILDSLSPWLHQKQNKLSVTLCCLPVSFCSPSQCDSHKDEILGSHTSPKPMKKFSQQISPLSYCSHLTSWIILRCILEF